jgi:outer membrane protein OmpA-like peptidoglycan-associated protein
VSGHRPSWGAFTGVSFHPGARKSAPMVVAATPVVQHDTITVRMVDTLVKVDTLRVNTRTHVTTSDTVTRTVEGRDVILVLRDANFDVGKSVLRPAARVSLDSLARALDAPAARALKITITGYTDSVGSDEYNMKLGMARATSVQKYLAAKGVDASRMAVDSRGEADPIASNATADGRQQNRRVVIGKQQR